MTGPPEGAAGGMGEFALIGRLRRKLAASAGPDIVVGNGDDAAVVEAGEGRCWVMTCDVQVQGVHFPEGASGISVGQKALAVNASDVAAMGGTPRYALISLGVRADTPVAFLDEVYEGINARAGRWGVAVLGGNVSRTEGPFFIDIFMVGTVERDRLLLRSGARLGDQILVTGFLGDAAAGLHLLGHPEAKVRDEARTALIYAQLRPTARVEEGKAVAALKKATAMMDLSDGLAGDLGHLCEASGVGAVVWEQELPISPAALELAAAARLRPEEWALYGGEDYQLLLTAPVEAVPALQKAVREAGALPLTPIGEIVPAGQGLRLKRGEDLLPLRAGGWDHLKDK
ncbi:MAG: thiamine-phosphate kinase [Candidatus Tectomicrobia bacterium]|uniref:Thiamine-monophosphate kinase n=1 Tax=Tectimicrobiota bacterium TaxID=2528274 RepID=A0A932I038_UNCTE|nr:thiamine-phosphate kinase [Candidatus Tectomicrobia bacterium]